MPGIPNEAEGLKDFKIPKKNKVKTEVKEEDTTSDDDFKTTTNGKHRVKKEESEVCAILCACPMIHSRGK